MLEDNLYSVLKVEAFNSMGMGQQYGVVSRTLSIRCYRVCARTSITFVTMYVLTEFNETKQKYNVAEYIKYHSQRPALLSITK